MAVSFKQSIPAYLLTALLFSCAASADRPDGSENAIEHMRASVQKAQQNLDETMTKCRDNLPAVDLSSSLSADINKKQLFVAIFYLSDKAIERCEAAAWGVYLSRLTALRGLQAKHKLAMEANTDYELLIQDNAEKRIELEQKYQIIPTNSRAQLKKHPGIQSPFNAVATARKSGV